MRLGTIKIAKQRFLFSRIYKIMKIKGKYEPLIRQILVISPRAVVTSVILPAGLDHFTSENIDLLTKCNHSTFP